MPFYIPHPSQLIGVKVTIPAGSYIMVQQGKAYKNSGTVSKELTGTVSKVQLHANCPDYIPNWNLFQFAGDTTHWYLVWQIVTEGWDSPIIGEHRLMLTLQGTNVMVPYQHAFDYFTNPINRGKNYVPADEWAALIGKEVQANFIYQFVDFDGDSARFKPGPIQQGQKYKVIGMLTVPSFVTVKAQVDNDRIFTGWENTGTTNNLNVFMLDGHDTYDLKPNANGDTGYGKASMDLPYFAAVGDVWYEDLAD